mmetsp:Transcript_50768/g.99249  ORF Transcript_50768/g.99249 Transcript_50768/m.99249 type:complete len:411 (-) Transcript_50768:500-1732(-)
MPPNSVKLSLVLMLLGSTTQCDAFSILPSASKSRYFFTVCAKKAGKKKRPAAATSGGFGAPAATKSSSKSNKFTRKSKENLLATSNVAPSNEAKGMGGTPSVKSDQDALLESLSAAASLSPIGKAVLTSPLHGTSEADEFYELMPSLISSKFPNVSNDKLHRVAGFVRHALDPNLPLEDSIVQDPHRPHDEIHAYMSGLGETKPFHDPADLELCQRLSANFDVIEKEYEALVEDMQGKGKKDRFQSVTSMNYEGGWMTLVLFYNGHRIKNFPYHLCPVTTEIMESVPLAGRIAGFNRQKPLSGIPKHSDGNNMWLTCQMGIKVPDGQKAFIRVGPETRRWGHGECLLYDTTYDHETMNESESQERVVLHIDFFNILVMTPEEIEIMRYVYFIREQFMKAEGVAKVGAQIL